MADTFHLGDFQLQSGVVLPDAKLSYDTHGALNEAGDNAIVFGTWATGRHTDVAALVGKLWPALDPQEYFIVVPDMFCDGLSTSPSNSASPYDGPRFPLVTPYDNVVAQHRLMTEHLGARRVRLVVGFSMSGQQAYHWGAHFPEVVDALCIVCGSAKTSAHNWAYLAGLRAIMECAAGWNDGACDQWPPALHHAIVRIMLMMVFSQEVFRAGHHLTGRGQSFDSTEAYFNAMQTLFLADWHPVDFYHQLATWMAADVSAHPKFGGDMGRALAAIFPRTILMPCETDQYFRVADNEAEVARMPNAELRVIRSIWGHAAGGGFGDPADNAFINAAIAELLSA